MPELSADVFFRQIISYVKASLAGACVPFLADIAPVFLIPCSEDPGM